MPLQLAPGLSHGWGVQNTLEVVPMPRLLEKGPCPIKLVALKQWLSIYPRYQLDGFTNGFLFPCEASFMAHNLHYVAGLEHIVRG